MAIFKCKMCGGSLEVTEGMTVCECEYCGTKQTIPKSHDDVLTNNFNRANNLRMKNEFDKAQELYEKIVSANPTEAEAYWGIVLCKYGIEYVEDPTTLKKIPTCHRTQYESVVSDVDYHSAIENADARQKELFEKEAAEIDKLQKNILEIVHKEKPFDVFICYKETDENGKRTSDSVIANDIYYQLTQEGFKVFYAAITLEDKLGQEYEPYIFAALNSAKVMLVIGSNPEYFNAVWVKNEWSRYLKLMKSDRSKLLIPCYKDMDAYDLPEEFAHLQAQDMSKIGFINDVIRGMKKVLVKDTPVKTNNEVIKSNQNSSTGSLLKRASIFLENRRWEEATEYANKVLDIAPESGDAYAIALMAEYHVNDINKLCSFNCLKSDFSESFYYINAVKFGRTDLIECHNESVYQTAKMIAPNNTENALQTAINLLHSVGEYKDSYKLINEYERIKSELQKQREQMEYEEKQIENERVYNEAQEITAGNASEEAYFQAALLLRSISGYKQSDELRDKYESIANSLKAQREQQIVALQNKRSQIYNGYQIKSRELSDSIKRLKDNNSAKKNR